MSRSPSGEPGATRCGFVALLGWTNVGKSTLLNRLVGTKLAAVAEVAQTTRRRLTGVLSVPSRGQLVFVDTPGMHRPRHKMNRAMVDIVRRTISAVDVGLLVVDAERGPGEGDAEVAGLMRNALERRLMVLNKIDRVTPKSKLLPMMQKGVEEWGFAEVVPVSAQTGDGCEELLECLWRHVPEGPPAFPEDYLTDEPERVLAAEWIREKLLARTREDVPHSIAVVVDGWNERDDGLVEISALIVVERSSQKGIVIGREGELLREVGTLARTELEQLLGRRVFLRLWVKVREDWRNDDHVLRELGLA